MNEEEKELLEIYNDIFIGDTQLLALVATKAYNKLSKTHNKEEISVIAEILMALSKAPVVVDRKFTEMPVYAGSEDGKPLFTVDLSV